MTCVVYLNNILIYNINLAKYWRYISNSRNPAPGAQGSSGLPGPVCTSVSTRALLAHGCQSCAPGSFSNSKKLPRPRNNTPAGTSKVSDTKVLRNNPPCRNTKTSKASQHHITTITHCIAHHPRTHPREKFGQIAWFRGRIRSGVDECTPRGLPSLPRTWTLNIFGGCITRRHTRYRVLHPGHSRYRVLHPTAQGPRSASRNSKFSGRLPELQM